jgi:general secretion pathway protein G
MKINQNNRRRFIKAKGFTLLEMVIVLGIIGLILGGAISMMSGFKDGAAESRIKGDFSSIGTALKMYNINNGFYPSSAQGIKALVEKPSGNPAPKTWSAIYTKVPLDPYNQEYIYKFPGSKNASEFELICKGKDGQIGTDDDRSSQNQ